MPIRMQVTETMKGLHHFVDPALGDATDRPLWFRIHWSGTPGRVLNPLSGGFMTYDAAGEILVAGLTDGPAPCLGTFSIDYIRKRKITYDLTFDAGDHAYRYVGEKTDVNLLRPLQLIKTHTTCYGTVTRDDGVVVSRSVIHFDPGDLLSLVTSFKLGAD